MRLIDWLQDACANFELGPVAFYRKQGEHGWPLTAGSEDELLSTLEAGGHFLPLPKEPAALANIIEVSLVDFLLEKFKALNNTSAQRGTERGYPDIEISGDKFGGGYHAVDVKMARRGKSRKQTQSRITLYTGNTYFQYPTLPWPGTFRSFAEYDSHLVMVGIYTLNEDSLARIEDFELIIQESWQIGSKQRSSTTREYIGAVMKIDDLRAGNGEFATAEEFYTFWRKFPFKIGRAVQQRLDKLLAQQG